jgi:hypothetical protein
VELSDATPVEDAKWPLWTWFAYPALAIAIGGGLGYFVAVLRQSRQPTPVMVEAVVAAPQPPNAPTAEVAPPPSPEIEIEPDPVKAANDGLAPRVAPKAKGKQPKPIKGSRCNVYDHMNGC